MNMTNTYPIAVLPGDGICPEVIAQEHKVLDAVRQRFDMRNTTAEYYIGGIAIDRHGSPLPPAGRGDPVRFSRRPGVGHTCHRTSILSVALYCHYANTLSCSASASCSFVVGARSVLPAALRYCCPRFRCPVRTRTDWRHLLWLAERPQRPGHVGVRL